MKTNFEVTCEETDYLVDEAMKIKGCLGARMTGGGFGGSVIILAQADSTSAFEDLLTGYKARFSATPSILEAIPSVGAGLLCRTGQNAGKVLTRTTAAYFGLKS
ncbi:MAG: hypothetical protein A2293_03160 [Elusimicrobia bacterium RIFOXYB2_FULL_49_7]|nr:MAG: hypothetical protein A2293_03160 [Elusimicrobia bacterium RIFOXYB2_FULL_49_7]